MGHDQSPPGFQWVIIGEDIESISGQRQDLTSLVRRIVAMPQPHIPSNMHNCCWLANSAEEQDGGAVQNQGHEIISISFEL